MAQPRVPISRIGKFFEDIGPRERPLLPIEMEFDNKMKKLQNDTFCW